MSLKDKVALVTGGSRGIGRAIAEAFARMGATVVICGRKLYSLEQVALDNEMMPGSIVPIQCNVTRLEEMECMVETILQEQGRIDVLVNNAALNVFSGSALDLGEGEFDRTVEMNIKSVFRMTRLVAPSMCDHHSGTIINIAATAGLRPEPCNLLYSMTNAAVLMMTRSYALELAPHGVRVNAIAPGLIQTEMSSHVWKDDYRLREHLARQPVRHVGQPEEVAEIALMLAGERASFVTGQTFAVDGGLMLT